MNANKKKLREHSLLSELQYLYAKKIIVASSTTDNLWDDSSTLLMAYRKHANSHSVLELFYF